MKPVESQSLAAHRWWARGSIVAMALAVVLVVSAEGRVGVTLLIGALIAAVAVLAGGYWFLAKRGAWRWIGAGLAVAAITFVIVVFLRRNVLIFAVLAVLLLLLGGFLARLALRHPAWSWMPVERRPPPEKPFIVMNPHSGGGKVVKFDLQRKAEALGAEVFLMQGPGHIDVAALVRDAVGRGADLLGVAGGDGTQALVAGIAAEHDVPLLVISAGTRNHFALDLGLDREDPSGCLQALTDGEEVRVDLGMINGRPFVNNASFGAYAEIVQSSEYRDNKERTILAMLPDLLSGETGARLRVRAGATELTDLQAALISNNPYGVDGQLLDLGRRPRLDRGQLGLVGGRLASAAQAVGLLGRSTSIVSQAVDGEVIVDADTDSLPVGIDGEAVTVTTPVRCTLRPRALRVLLPRDRPGVPAPVGRVTWKGLWSLAFGSGETEWTAPART